MNVDKTLNYLRSAAFQAAERKLEPRPFVTISRQAGAGGASLAEALVERMRRDSDPLFADWRVFDRKLCETIAADPRLSVSMEALAREAFRTSFADYLAQLLADASPQATVVKRTFEAVRAAARLGGAVIVGRAGCCLTRELPLGVHVRLVASKEARLARYARRYGLEPAAAKRQMEEEELARARLVRVYFRRDIDDPLLYDCVWNTDAVAFDAIAAALMTLVAARAGAAARPAA